MVSAVSDDRSKGVFLRACENNPKTKKNAKWLIRIGLHICDPVCFAIKLGLPLTVQTNTISKCYP